MSLSESTRQQNAAAFGGDPSQVPSQALTLGLQEILAADEIHLIVTGSAKAEILKALFDSPCTDQMPASWLRNHARVSLWLDQAALTREIIPEANVSSKLI
ncbi:MULTISPECIES: 6-phosphogluconolactonase [unclassified Prochlorococcus]|uniref:6-phosphogluconolactonase n=1 Tax=unclassified Prochlorococcus TaxID=2627481 RepID=UPI0039A6705B